MPRHPRGAEAIPPPLTVDESPRRLATVLCVEDSPIHLKVIGRQLEHALGCRVLPAEDVETAVTILLRERPDLIVTDLMMPDLDGLDFLEILRGRPGWREIPVVVHSVVGDLRRVRDLIDSGVRDYILKPFESEVAIPKFKRLLARLPRWEVPTSADALSNDPGRIPVLLVTTVPGLPERVCGAVPPLYDVMTVASGPEAVAAALEARAWAALVTPECGQWDLTKTMKSLLALRTFEKIRCLPLPSADRGHEVVVAAVERELRSPPFSVTPDEVQTTATIHETFTSGCVGALKRNLAEATGQGTKRIVIDIPFHALAPPTITALQALTHALEDADGGGGR